MTDDSANESDSQKGEKNKKNGGKRKDKIKYKKVNLLESLERLISRDYYEDKVQSLFDVLAS
jgi:hypothetical protein